MDVKVDLKPVPADFVFDFDNPEAVLPEGSLIFDINTEYGYRALYIPSALPVNIEDGYPNIFGNFDEREYYAGFKVPEEDAPYFPEFAGNNDEFEGKLKPGLYIGSWCNFPNGASSGAFVPNTAGKSIEELNVIASEIIGAYDEAIVTGDYDSVSLYENIEKKYGFRFTEA